MPASVQLTAQDGEDAGDFPNLVFSAAGRWRRTPGARGRRAGPARTAAAVAPRQLLQLQRRSVKDVAATLG